MIVLVGFMGAGKTTVGRFLADELGLEFIDTDLVVERRAGRSVTEIFRDSGEEGFRRLEREAVRQGLGGPESVIALGGGALGDEATRRDLEDVAAVVHLAVSFDEVRRRIGGDGTRPLLAGDARALFESRRKTYESVAGHHITTDHRTPEVVAREIASSVAPRKGFSSPNTQRAAASEPPGDASHARRVVVDLPGRSYNVFVGSGLAGALARLLPELPDAERAFVVTHPSLEATVAPAIDSLRASGLTTHVLCVTEGERSKSLETCARLYDELAEAGAHRHDLVVSGGGGVVCDLAGYVASTYNRGLAVAHLPTTLLAQVDAAIGGKTGVNLAQGKNLVGSIHQPVAVVCDVGLLGSLPERDLMSGMAEVIKYGLIADPSLLAKVESKSKKILAGEEALLAELVERSVAIKASLVQADERDTGVRAYLNYGHTFAHAIEKAAGFAEVTHGEAVALGMMAAAHVAFELGRIEADVVDVHLRVLEQVGLPTSAELDLDVLERAWVHDKKYRRGVRFVLLAGLGRPESDVEVPREALARALERMAG